MMAAADEAEFVHMVTTCAASTMPVGAALPARRRGRRRMPERGVPLEIGRGRIVREGTKIALLSFGARCRMPESGAGTRRLRAVDTVADARFAKPLDTDLINRLVREHEVVITIEEGAVGGFGSHVLHYLAQTGMLDHGLKIRTMCLPDIFIDHDCRGRSTRSPGSTRSRSSPRARRARPRDRRPARPR